MTLSQADDALTFLDDEPRDEGPRTLVPPWRVLVVDDDPDLHEATEFALHGLYILDRPLEFLHAHSAAAALQLLSREHDIAVILLDVVMETVTAGLDMIGVIRDDMGLASTRIILRTGQPGLAPDVDTVRRYDINDYHTKSELTRGRLYVALSTAIRAYDQLERTAANQRFLERVVAASHRLIALPGLREFSAGLLGQAIKRIHRYVEDRSEVGFFSMGTHLAEYALFTSTPTNHYPHPPEPCRKLRAG